MITRIFLPESIYRVESIAKFKDYYIFGKIVSDHCNSITIFIVDVREANERVTSDQQLIGIISKDASNIKGLISDYIRFEIDKINSLLEFKTVELPNFISTPKSVQIFLFDFNKFVDLSQRNDDRKWCQRQDTISQLLRLIKIKEEQMNRESHESQDKSNKNRLIFFLMSLATFTQTKLSFLNSSLLKHFHFWVSNLEKLTKRRVLVWTIAFDIIAGIITMLWLWRISNADEYLMQLTMFILKQLQGLLDELKGSPVGLKLNVDLNNFFISCFRYHVDLWATFLDIISPLVKYLFVPLAIIGCFGLSFQLSMLADLLTVITLHAHCIYTYVSIIHKIEINGLFGVWRVVSGRRKNILKDRIESYEYTNPQLYLSTIFFSALLFLFPTNLIYYIVFASLRFAIQCITFLLTFVQQKLLSTPVAYIFKWSLGQYASLDNFEVMPMENIQNGTHSVAFFSIRTVRSAFPSWFNTMK